MNNKTVEQIARMKEQTIVEKACPKCGQIFTERPAVSRVDNVTLICPDCGTREALASLGVEPEEQNEILDIIHEKSR